MNANQLAARPRKSYHFGRVSDFPARPRGSFMSVFAKAASASLFLAAVVGLLGWGIGAKCGQANSREGVYDPVTKSTKAIP